MVLDRCVPPLLPLRDTAVYPAAAVVLKVGRDSSKRAVEQSLRDPERRIAAVAQKRAEEELPLLDGLYEVGTLCRVAQVIEGPGGVYHVSLEGLTRIRLGETVEAGVCRRVTAEPFVTVPGRKREIIRLRSVLESLLIEVARLRDRGRSSPRDLFDEEDDERFLDRACAAYLSPSLPDAQRVIGEPALEDRYAIVIEMFKREAEARANEARMKNEWFRQLPGAWQGVGDEHAQPLEGSSSAPGEEQSPRGETHSDEDLLRQRIRNLDAPETVKEKLSEEFERYRTMPPMSAEAGVSRLYIDTLLALPWRRRSETAIDMARAEAVLDDEHFGLDEVKKRILEYLAVLKLSQGLKAPILCLVGPPGVGKTSIAASVARAIGRQFVRTSLGGIRDEAEIRGHRRTYVGSMPGRIIQGIRRAKVRNPLFLLDELDKMGSDYKGDPASALLEVLDPEQNSAFVDHYVDIEFDLSEVLFVATANDETAIPRALHDRLEIIHIEGYTYYEKSNIARRFLIEKQKKLNGIADIDIRLSEEALEKLVDGYTSEAGVRELERKIAAICRRVALDRVKGKARRPVRRITAQNIEEYLGPAPYSKRKEGKAPVPGVVNGLAWTPYGGTVLTIEAVRCDGRGNIRTTGSLGEVMKESVEIALTLVRSLGMRVLDIPEERWRKSDLHVHFPEGAVPKDGPSAGVAVALAVASVMSGVPVGEDVAVTGEVTLRGAVLRVGGLRAKLMAAKKEGIKTVFIPRDNVPELVKIPDEIKSGIRIVPVEWAGEVIQECLSPALRPSASCRDDRAPA